MPQTLHQSSVSLDTALALIRQSRWAEAMQMLAVLAQGGDARAMEIAGKISMVHHDVEGALGWFRRALAAGETAGRLCDVANALSATGAGAQALEYYQKAIACDPVAPGPHFYLGRMLLAGNKPEAAVAELRKAVAADENYLQARLSLGDALLRCGAAEEGRTELEWVLSKDTENAQALSLIAAAEVAQEDTDKAIQHCTAALKKDPDNVKALGTLGGIWFRRGEYELALQYFRRCLTLQPGSGRAHNNCGLALIKLGQEEEAISHFRQALSGPNAFYGAAINLGSALHLSGKIEESLELFQLACKKMPENPQAFAGLADVQQSLGNGDAAYHAFLHTIELAPDAPETYRRLLSMGTDWPLPPEWLAHLKEMELHEADMSDKDRSELHFALYRVSEYAGENDAAIHHLLAANAARRKIMDYDEAAELGVMEKVRLLTPASLFQKKAGSGDPSDVPVFIVGMPRSGSTLLEQMIASHPDVYGMGEIPDFGEVIGCHGRNLPDIDFDTASGSDLKILGGRYMKRIRKFSGDALRLINKQPWNYQLAGYIHLLLPNAHIIHLRRDPMDTCFSCFEQNFRGSIDFCYELGELGRYYRAYERMMAHWREVLPEGTICEVSYEDLVENPEAEMRRILDFCGLEWDPACLEFYKSKRAVRTASVMQVRQPINHGSLGRWKRYGEAFAPLQLALGLNPAE